MRNTITSKKYPFAFLYIWATFICLTIVFLYICLNGGSAISKWLFWNVRDTGNDFFNCIPAVKGYGLGYDLIGQYPPLAKMFFLLTARIYSFNNISLDTTIRNSMTDPRMQQAALVPFVIFILFTTFSIIVLVSKLFEDEKQAVIIGISIIGTYSVLFAIERGNIICLSFMFIMYFILYYQSDNRILKETALISLALSAGLKLYPAAFGIVLLYEKRWREAIRTIIYGIMSLAVPYFITKNYLPEDEASDMVSSVSEWAKGLLDNLFGLRPIQQQILIVIAIIIALIGMVTVAIKGSKHWIKIFYVGVLAMICGVQFGYLYAYVFLIPSFVLFMKDEKKIDLKNSIYFMLMCMLNLPLPIFGEPTSAKVPLVGEFKMWVLFGMIIYITIVELLFVGKEKVE